MTATILHIRDYKRPEERQAAVDAACLDAVDRALFDEEPIVKTDGWYFGGDETA